jgi:hypothetical protein
VTEKNPDVSPQLDTEHVTDEVGSEGGSPGDVERSHTEVGAGSEAGEVWRPEAPRTEELDRDETPPGRRSP